MRIQFKGPILVVGAHPDDAELMAGGLISRAVSDGATVYSVIISDGCENGEAIIRQEEAQKSAKILGMEDVFFHGVKDGCVPHDINMVKTVEGYLKKIDPAMVITHCPNDTHQDHRNVCNITLSATRRTPGVVLLGETPSSIINDNLVCFDITDTFRKKLHALKVYHSQIQNGPVILQNAKTLATYRGQRIGTKYAEAFNIWRMLL